jgi:hypothetical protein
MLLQANATEEAKTTSNRKTKEVGDTMYGLDFNPIPTVSN